jgi:MFS transporter, putative metabolite:H+ symporter
VQNQPVKLASTDAPSRPIPMFTSAGHALFFWVGSAAVAAGVALHLPMFWMSRNMGFRLAGMPMGWQMYLGMACILVGTAAVAYGLLPPAATKQTKYATLVPQRDAPLTSAHWVQMAILSVALVINVMKAATLGFVTPGMRVEYGLSPAGVAVLPFIALIGTVVGSFIWGALADVYGRRASILLAAVIFIGTAICGAMPSFRWNIFMCFDMGLSAGGMLPVANALLAEIMPTRHRGWCLVLLGGISTVGGYFATSELSALLQPHFGWRIMWLIGFPTGLLLIALSPFMPESASFLVQRGRLDEARVIFARFGTQIAGVRQAAVQEQGKLAGRTAPAHSRALLGTTIALTLAALTWGFVNYGLLLWLPSSLVAAGHSVGVASEIIAQSTLIAIPTIAVATYLYSVWSSKRALMLAIGVIALGLLAMPLQGSGGSFLANPLLAVSLLIIGTSGVISYILPYAAESFPIRVRGRATGWVAGCSKAGGVLAQGLAAVALVPGINLTAALVAVPTLLSLLLVGWFGNETLGRDLGELEAVEAGAQASRGAGYGGSLAGLFQPRQGIERPM